ncbi:hypothetical protein DU80_01525 [Methanosarcina mazei]|jgi:hypothetical protein|uniref:Uncharacterized protein n=1 Tax=Methanosarcina mazei TaxID=2209 RepID=A0A0F8L469_METMZ|nr:hypothetical protein DU47_05320 [Methanosarcina mazei]KKG01373.1 hypothetical protein DU40_09375 [Methanosarcina mazei]KKG08028.1 hypothetical protein DU31_20035 [Methanosarcina mazei]KKG14567.1 hypothetical protein DU34_02405 [Methanosarcina mazei]KKG31131.1 hypothetical protein DU49_19915 [Methanosarcina mazei]
MGKDFHFLFSGSVSDRPSENMTQLTGFHFNSKTTTLVKNILITLENSPGQNLSIKVKLIVPKKILSICKISGL